MDESTSRKIFEELGLEEATKKTVLVVDDDRNFLDRMRYILEEAGYSVTTIKDATKVENLIRNQKF